MLPQVSFPPELLLKAQGIKLLFLDVDGVLTDAGLYYGSGGEEIKRFNTLDGFGLRLLQRAGIGAVIVSGRDSRALRLRLAELEIGDVHCGVDNKLALAQRKLATSGLDWQRAAAMGDDWPDLALMRSCALACAPANAHTEVKLISHYVTQARGGAGALREVCDLLLCASGQYRTLLEACA